MRRSSSSKSGLLGLGGEGFTCPRALDPALLKGSRDLVTKVIIRVTILITAYNPSYGTYNLSYQVP